MCDKERLGMCQGGSGEKAALLAHVPVQKFTFPENIPEGYRETVHRYFPYIKNKYRSTDSCPNLQCSSILQKMELY